MIGKGAEHTFFNQYFVASLDKTALNDSSEVATLTTDALTQT
jgi:hypothetical protein